MRVLTTIAEVRASVQAYRRQGLSITLVPTMGYLHEGHLALVKRAGNIAERTIVSIFVNPTQFGEESDLETYPKDPERDLALLQPLGVDGVFMPSANEIYGTDNSTIVDVTALSSILQGTVRPGHFQGVATVVAKLLNIVQPDTAIFGEKDYQQLTLIKRMVADLNMTTQIVGHPTVRDTDGMALSSRNVRLTPEDRRAATILFQALQAGKQAAEAGDAVETMHQIVTDTIRQQARATIRSIDIRDAETLSPVVGHPNKPVVILLSVQFGEVLLIDQMIV